MTGWLPQAFPAWQVLLLDLRCHGQSAGMSNSLEGPHDLGTAASDVVGLLRKLRLFPHVLIGGEGGCQ